jgi:hypothetical protein
MFSSYNRKVAKTTCPFPIQPPRNISRMMEPLSHYHCEIHCCKSVPINLHQTTYTKQLVINLYHKKLHQPCTNLYLNLYHQQVHQPFTKYVPITTHHDVPTSSTIHVMYVPTHQLLVSTMYLNQKPSSISSHTCKPFLTLTTRD